ncbi:MAG: hypothetical protein ABH865_05655 [Candidatus Omnitrophota bacterium]
MRKHYIGALIIFILISFLATSGFARDTPELKKPQFNKTRVAKEIQGEVTWLARDRIAVVFSSTADSEQEMLLPFDADVQIVHKKGLRDIGVGDAVSVAYEEVTEETPEGAKTRRKAKSITFLRKAPAKPTPYGVEDKDTGVLVSGVGE